MQRALTEMLSAASTDDETDGTAPAEPADIETPGVEETRDPKQDAAESTGNPISESTDASAIPVPTIPDGAQIGAVENDEERIASAEGTGNDADSESVGDDSNPETDAVTENGEAGDEATEPEASVDRETDAQQIGDDATDIEQKACENDIDDTPDSTDGTADAAETSEDSVDDGTADTDAAKEAAAGLGDDLTPNGHETLQEQADRIAKEESRRTLESIATQLDASGDKAIDDFISGKIKEALAERDEYRRNGDKRGVERLGKRLNEIAKLRDGDGRTLDGVTAGYDKIMKDEDDRLMLIAKHEAEQEERERVKRVDALAAKLKEMAPDEAQQAIAEIDGNDYMTLAERHAALVSDITSYAEEPDQEQDTDETNHEVTDDKGVASATDDSAEDSAEADTDDTDDADRGGDDTESDGSNGLKEYYDRYGGEPSHKDIGVIWNKPHEQSEKAKRRQERRQREKERQALLEKRAEERAEREGVSVEEIATRGDRPMTAEEIGKRRKGKRDGRLTALSVAKSAIGIASLAGIEGYAVFEALKAVHDDGKALSGFQSVEHMIVPMLLIAAVWFVLSLVLRAVSKNAASGVLSDKGERDANVKQISYLSADLGVCGRTVLIDAIRLVSMVVAGGLTLVGIGSVAGTDTAMGVAYGIAVLLAAVGIVGKRLYLFGSDDDDDVTVIEDSVTYGLAEIQRRIEPVNAAFRPLLAASAAAIVAMSIVTFLPLRTGTQLSDLGTDAWLSLGAIVALALGRCIAVWVPRSAEDVTSFSSFAWSLLLMFGLSAATALFVVGQYVPAAISVALIALICIGLKILGRGRDSVADLDDYEIE